MYNKYGVMKMKKIYIVEDDEKLLRYIELELKHEGYEVSFATDGKVALEQIQNEQFDLVILDIMLPGMNGMEICRRVRMKSSVPIVMLTARGETMDKISGLDIGADDYITKPFEIEEFLARVRRFFRENNSSDKEVKCGKLVIDKEKHVCKYDGEAINLSKTEYDLCMYLMENVEKVLSREQILEKVWGYDYFGETRVVDVYIRYLREKIDDKYNENFIQTIRGVGYAFKCEGE